MLDDPRIISLADEKARMLLRKHQSSGSLRGSVEVDVFSLAKELGLEVIEKTPKNPSRLGAIYYDGARDKFVILVNPLKSKPIQRFTVAHEIAHFLLDSDGIKGKGVEYRDEGRRSTYLERSAEGLAAEILMPKRSLENVMMSGRRDLRELARYFGVTEYAMFIRLERAGLARMQ